MDIHIVVCEFDLFQIHSEFRIFNQADLIGLSIDVLPSGDKGTYMYIR